ncbi:MAG: hypothetical protein WCV56_08865, partial [Candidatus Omnitrophota bacterium]
KITQIVFRPESESAKVTVEMREQEGEYIEVRSSSRQGTNYEFATVSTAYFNAEREMVREEGTRTYASTGNGNTYESVRTWETVFGEDADTGIETISTTSEEISARNGEEGSPYIYTMVITIEPAAEGGKRITTENVYISTSDDGESWREEYASVELYNAGGIRIESENWNIYAYDVCEYYDIYVSTYDPDTGNILTNSGKYFSYNTETGIIEYEGNNEYLYDGTGSWTAVSYWSDYKSYDNARDKMIMSGNGKTAEGNTWRYDGEALLGEDTPEYLDLTVTTPEGASDDFRIEYETDETGHTVTVVTLPEGGVLELEGRAAVKDIVEQHITTGDYRISEDQLTDESDESPDNGDLVLQDTDTVAISGTSTVHDPYGLLGTDSKMDALSEQQEQQAALPEGVTMTGEMGDSPDRHEGQIIPPSSQ